MAAHDDVSASEKKSNDATTDLPTFNAENLQSNMKVIYYSRTFMSIIGGVIAGILGFTGLMGFVVYLLVMAITSIGLTAKAGFSIHSYFDSWNRVLVDGFLGGLMVFQEKLDAYINRLIYLPLLLQSFVLFWTFAYDIVHIF